MCICMCICMCIWSPVPGIQNPTLDSLAPCMCVLHINSHKNTYTHRHTRWVNLFSVVNYFMIFIKRSEWFLWISWFSLSSNVRGDLNFIYSMKNLRIWIFWVEKELNGPIYSEVDLEENAVSSKEKLIVGYFKLLFYNLFLISIRITALLSVSI